MRNCSALKDQTEAVGMIIENQNAMYFVGARAAHLLNNEKSLSAETGLSDPGRSLDQLRLASGDWPN
jgi:hypothetical protein